MSESLNGENLPLYEALASCCLERRIEAGTDARLQVSADFVFPADYPGFAGHFPGKPILPAIVQLAAVRYLVEGALGRKVAVDRYEKTKFKGMIGPDDRVVVAIALNAGTRGWSGRFSLTRSDGETAAAGLVEFIPEGI